MKHIFTMNIFRVNIQLMVISKVGMKTSSILKKYPSILYSYNCFHKSICLIIALGTSYVWVSACHEFKTKSRVNVWCMRDTMYPLATLQTNCYQPVHTTLHAGCTRDTHFVNIMTNSTRNNWQTNCNLTVNTKTILCRNLQLVASGDTMYINV